MAFNSSIRLSECRNITKTNSTSSVKPTWAPSRGTRCSAAAAASDMGTASKYAILRLGGVRQMLQEGLLYTCPKQCLLQEQYHQQEHFSTSTVQGNGASSIQQPLHPVESPPTTAAAPTASAASDEQRSFLLRNVLGLHNGKHFTWGTPYVPDTLVEVEVVEEFPGPQPLSTPTAAPVNSDSANMMTIYRVKHIRAAQ